MPIKGVTDVRRLPRVGKLHLGHKEKKGDREYPKQDPHFVVRADDTTPMEAAQAFWEVYGEAPTELDIIFPTDDPSQWADANYKAWSRQWGLRCKGDGETAQAKWDASGNGPRPPGIESGTWATRGTERWAYMDIPCLAEECPLQQTSPPKCKAVMNLQFILPRVEGIGIWQIDTGSWNSIHNINNNVDLIRAVTGGRVRGLPLKLRRVPKEVTPANTGTKTVYVLDIYAPITLNDLLKTAAQLPEHGLMLLPAPDEERPDDLFPGEAEEDEWESRAEDEPPAAPGEAWERDQGGEERFA